MVYYSFYDYLCNVEVRVNALTSILLRVFPTTNTLEVSDSSLNGPRVLPFWKVRLRGRTARCNFTLDRTVQTFFCQLRLGSITKSFRHSV